MTRQTHQFIQSITHNNEELDLGFIVEASYIERTDIVGPLLILRFNDSERLIREHFKIKAESLLYVALGDPVGRDFMHESERFTVQSIKMSADVLTLNCVQSDAYQLLAQAAKARFFVGDSAVSVIKKLMNSAALDYQSSQDAVIESYHLLPQQRPFDLIRQITRETGRLAFITRGKLYFKTFAEMQEEGLKRPLQYHHNDTRQDNQIIGYRLFDGAWKAKDLTKRNYVAFDMEKGVISSGDSKAPTVFLGAASKTTLKAISNIPVPVIEFIAEGNSELSAGKVCNIKWNKLQTESPIDESLPENILIGSVTHYSRANRYQCKVAGLV